MERDGERSSVREFALKCLNLIFFFFLFLFQIVTEGEFMLKRKIRSRESQLDLNIMNLEMEQRILFEFGILRILSSANFEENYSKWIWIEN